MTPMTAAQQAEQDEINAQEMAAQGKAAMMDVGEGTMKKMDVGEASQKMEAKRPAGSAGTGQFIGAPEMSWDRNNSEGRMQQKTMKATKMKSPAMSWDRNNSEAQMPTRAQPGTDLTLIVAAVNNLNATFNKLLSSIESRLKKNDVIPQLKKMNGFISEINDSMPIPTAGGGTRRSRMKKSKKTLRNRRA